MRLSQTIAAVWIALAFALSAFSQPTDTEVRIFNSNVRSLKIAPVDNAYGVPIIKLNSD